MSTDDFAFDVFLSHSAKDKAVVRPLAERLRKDGLKVWFDEWVLRPGDSIPAKIEEGLEHSRVLVLCMSANAFGSEWAQLEAGTFRFRDPLNKERRFIPLRLDDAPIKGSLAQFLYINWLPADPTREYAKLLAACRGYVQSPPANETTVPWPSDQAAQVVENPKSVILTTKKGMPQWANHLELNLARRRLEAVTCEIETESAYFRFGFKLFDQNGRLFGDGSIQSQDANLVVHIARDNRDNPNSGISPKDVFFTWYANGVSPEEDKPLFTSEPRFTVSLELRINSGNVLDFRVNGLSCLKRAIPAEIRRRVAVLAWGDRHPCTVEVRNLSVTTTAG